MSKECNCGNGQHKEMPDHELHKDIAIPASCIDHDEWLKKFLIDGTRCTICGHRALLEKLKVHMIMYPLPEGIRVKRLNKTEESDKNKTCDARCRINSAINCEYCDACAGEDDEECTNLDFSDALDLVKQGAKIARRGWNGKDMWVERIPHWDISDHDDRPHCHLRPPRDGEVKMLPFLALKTVDNGFVPWLASQTDLLASDWMVV